MDWGSLSVLAEKPHSRVCLCVCVCVVVCVEGGGEHHQSVTLKRTRALGRWHMRDVRSVLHGPESVLPGNIFWAEEPIAGRHAMVCMPAGAGA
jgi:hypothetical protein